MIKNIETSNTDLNKNDIISKKRNTIWNDKNEQIKNNNNKNHTNKI